MLDAESGLVTVNWRLQPRPLDAAAVTRAMLEAARIQMAVRPTTTPPAMAAILYGDRA